MGSIYVICSRQCPNGDGIYTLLYALYKYSTSITNQPTKDVEHTRATRVRFQDSPQGDNPEQQLYHARAEQLGELGLPGCDEALSGMGRCFAG